MTLEAEFTAITKYLNLVIRAGFLLFCGLLSSTVWATTTLTFCFQDTAHPPYYLGDGDEPNAGRPGATIEHLQLIVAKVPQVKLKLVRYSWPRCLKMLKTNQVDAVVANYADERHSLGVFPMYQNQPDPRREFNRQQVCLVAGKQLAKRWNGRSFNDEQEVTLAHHSGRKIDKLLPHRQFVKIPTNSHDRALQMLAANKVQAVSMVCKIAGKSALPPSFNPQTMQILDPPLEDLTAYLVFSYQFYESQQKIAEALWAQLSEPPVAIYLSYLHPAQAD